MKKLIAMFLAITMVFALCACGTTETSAVNSVATTTATTEASATEETKVEPIVLKMANTNTTAMWEDTELDLMAAEKYFIEQLPIRTEGRYEVNIYLDGQLASDTKEQVQGLKSGAFDICELSTANLGQFTNAYSEISIPYMFKNQDVVDYVLASEIGEEMNKRFMADVGGIVPLYYSDNGFRMLTHASKIIHTPEDLKGCKIRVMNDEIMIATFEALGCSIINVAYSELFTALQQKLCDAQENPATNIYNSKLYEVQDTCTTTNHMFTCFIYAMSEATFNSMSEADQQAVMKLSEECQQIRADKMKEVTDKYIERLKETGMEVYQPTDEELQAFADAMTEGVWPLCEEKIGTERWEKLNNTVAEAEAVLGCS